MLLEVDGINTFRGPAHVLRGVSIAVDTRRGGRRWSGAMAPAAPRSSRASSGCFRFAPAISAFATRRSPSLPPHRRARAASAMRRRIPASFPELTVAREFDDQPLAPPREGASGDSTRGDSEEGAFGVFPEVRISRPAGAEFERRAEKDGGGRAGDGALALI